MVVHVSLNELDRLDENYDRELAFNDNDIVVMEINEKVLVRVLII